MWGFGVVVPDDLLTLILYQWNFFRENLVCLIVQRLFFSGSIFVFFFFLLLIQIRRIIWLHRNTKKRQHLFIPTQVIMAVPENVGAKIGSSSQNLDNSVVSSDSGEVEQSKPRSGSINGDQKLNNGVFNHQDRVPNTMSVPNSNYNYKAQMSQMHANGMNNDGYVMDEENGGESFKRDMRDLEELLSKLNPMAEEFVPPSLTNSPGYLSGPGAGAGTGFGYPNNFILLNGFGNANGQTNRRVWMNCLHFLGYSFLGYSIADLHYNVFTLLTYVFQRKNGYNHGKRRVNHKIDMEKREEMIKRTVYVSDIDQLVQNLGLVWILWFSVRYNGCHVFSLEDLLCFVVM